MLLLPPQCLSNRRRSDSYCCSAACECETAGSGEEGLEEGDKKEAGQQPEPRPLRAWHHHTAAVAKLAAGVAPQEGAWADVVLSLGEDGNVGLISMGTLQVER